MAVVHRCCALRMYLSRTVSPFAIVRRPFASAGDPLRFVAPLARRRKPSPIRALQPLLELPGMISLGGGMPNPDLFPISGIDFTMTTGHKISLSNKEVAEALQYNATQGMPLLLKELTLLQQRQHKPHYSDWSIAVTTGSQDGLWKAFELMVSPGDNLLVENPTYAGALAWLHPFNCKLIGVDTDKDGLVPESLTAALSKFAPGDPNKPKVLYTIPTGQNPAGTTSPVERKKQIYKICCEHDIFILEDDPYFFLYYGQDAAPADVKQYKRPSLQSYFSMDTEQRVMRFDSMSKVLSSGIRVGFVTGPKCLMDSLNLHSAATNLHASNVSQIITAKLMNYWGEEGWNAHVDAVAYFYMTKRDMFTQAAKKHLPPQVKFTAPSAGMFVWFDLSGLGVTDTQELITKKAVEAKVLLVPGNAFNPAGSDHPSPFVRAAFSTANEEAIDTALSRFAALLKHV